MSTLSLLFALFPSSPLLSYPHIILFFHLKYFQFSNSSSSFFFCSSFLNFTSSSQQSSSPSTPQPLSPHHLSSLPSPPSPSLLSVPPSLTQDDGYYNLTFRSSFSKRHLEDFVSFSSATDAWTCLWWWRLKKMEDGDGGRWWWKLMMMGSQWCSLMKEAGDRILSDGIMWWKLVMGKKGDGTCGDGSYTHRTEWWKPVKHPIARTKWWKLVTEAANITLHPRPIKPTFTQLYLRVPSFRHFLLGYPVPLQLSVPCHTISQYNNLAALQFHPRCSPPKGHHILYSSIIYPQKPSYNMLLVILS